jgi:hypothetical protein
MAAQAVSGKATELLPRPATPSHPCPIALPPNLANKDYCNYLGWYDTDATLPSVYFLPDVARPSSVKPQTLDFTYLFDKSVDDGDFDLMGEGRQIKAARGQTSPSAALRTFRGYPVAVPISKVLLLREALSATE